VGKRLRNLVERWIAEPTAANRDAFYDGFILSMVHVPAQRDSRQGRGPGRPFDPMTVGPGGQPMFLVYTDAEAALQESEVNTAYGGSGRLYLEKALAARAGVTVATGAASTAPRAHIPLEDVSAVLNRERKEDPLLGLITWKPASKDEDGFWRFEAGPVSGHPVAGVVVPAGVWQPISPNELPRIHATVQWVRANDFVIRQHIATEMWDWWFNEYCDPPDREAIPTPERFRDTLELEVIRFEPGKDAYLVYQDHGLVCGYGILIWITPEGRFTKGPMMG
jgi:hypothetical protein